MKAVIILALICQPIYAQASGVCWEVQSNLKKSNRVYCSLVNSGQFTVTFNENHIFQQLAIVRPIPHALVLERAAEQNRKSGNSRLDRVERHGLPLAGVLGAAGVIGSGVVTAGLSAGAPIVIPAIRKWFTEASTPLWEDSPQLLSSSTVTMDPGDSAGFWFYSEKSKGDIGVREFTILPAEFLAVESAVVKKYGDPKLFTVNPQPGHFSTSIELEKEGFVRQSDGSYKYVGK